jgi:MscS family membrane protein
VPGDGDDGVSIWKISNASVSMIPTLYETYGYPEYIEDLRRSLPDTVFLGYELFKWVVLLAGGAIAYLIVFLIALIVRRLLGDTKSPSRRKIFRFLTLPVGIWVMLLTVNTVAMSLGQSVTAEFIQQVTPLPTLITVWVLYAGINLLRDVMSNRFKEIERPGTAVLLQPVSNALKLIIAAAAVLVYLDKLGVNITTVLAGLGVGGIAVALALQKPMEDVFGAITLYSQQPIRVGDFCRVGSETGTIEEIGLRTTRIRTLADTVIAIPNSNLATEPIDNISARSKIRYRPVLRLRYDATPQQIQQVLEGIRDLFSNYESMMQGNHRVRFFEIGDDALLVEAHGYLNTTDWAKYLELAEDLNLKILSIVNQAGTTLALPARHLQIEQSSSGLTALS